MTQQFHAGQEVEVRVGWRKAKIVEIIPAIEGKHAADDAILIEFQDGTRAVFDEAHIRAVSP